MSTITTAGAKSDFSRGLLTRFFINAAPMEKGWFITFFDKPSGQIVRLIDAHKKETRIFKTLDAAMCTIDLIGFETVQLCSY